MMIRVRLFPMQPWRKLWSRMAVDQRCCARQHQRLQGVKLAEHARLYSVCSLANNFHLTLLMALLCQLSSLKVLATNLPNRRQPLPHGIDDDGKLADKLASRFKVKVASLAFSLSPPLHSVWVSGRIDSVRVSRTCPPKGYCTVGRGQILAQLSCKTRHGPRLKRRVKFAFILSRNNESMSAI